MDANEINERERMLLSIRSVMDAFSISFNTYGLTTLPNLGMEVYNKMVMFSLMFYSRKLNFYTSALVDPISVNLLEMAEYGAKLFCTYMNYVNECITDLTFDMEKGLENNEDFIKITKEFNERYYDVFERIENFDLKNDILEASKNIIIKYKEKYSEQMIERIIKLFNLELSRLGIDVILPSLDGFNKMITDEDKGKEKRK